MAPGEMSRFQLIFRVDQTVAPERVLEVIQTALDSITGPDRIVADPRPKVKIRGVEETAVEYLVRYRLIPSELSPNSGRHLVNSTVLKALREAGMELATPRRRIQEERLT
jgi:small-conductance mechanosensitive channel